MDNPGHRLRISMTAQVTIVLNAVEDALTIPASLLSAKTPDGSYIVPVWNQQTEAIEPHKVKVGLNNKVTAEILSGLAEGDLVVNTTAISKTTTTGQTTSGNILAGGGPRIMVGPGPGG